MKIKFLCFWLLLIMLFQCVGCDTDGRTDDNSEQNGSDDKPITVEYTAEKMLLKYTLEEKEETELSNEDMNYMLSLWKSAQWKAGRTKTLSEYVFDIGIEIRYAESGVFNDWTNDRYVMLNEEQTKAVNSLIERAFSENSKKEQKPVVVIETPPDDYVYSFDSYDDVIEALTTKNTDGFLALREEQNSYGNVYTKTLSSFASKDIKAAVPQLNGSNINLREREGYANVSLMTCELYNLPWIWYHCVAEDYDLDVKISYPGVLENPKIDSAASYCEVLSLIAPNAPSPSNYKQYESYQSVYEEELALADGKNVTAMIYELKNSAKVHVMFYQNGMLISLCADSQLFSDEFWSSFSVARH